MHGMVIGVLRGGPSREHEVSLKTGHAIASNLPRDRYTVRDIYIDRQGIWHERGKPTDPSRALRTVDAVVIGLHGEFGEDGQVQRILETLKVPFAGADSLGSYLAMHKVLAKEKAKEIGLLTPRYHLVEEGTDVEAQLAEVVRTFHQPVVVKPVKWGSSIGVSIVAGYAPLLKVTNELLESGSGGVLIEELIKGTEATAGVVEGLRGEALYKLPPIEIVPPEKDFFSYEAKYTGVTKEICPGRFKKDVSEELMRQAAAVHEALGLRHYSRTDFIISPKGIYYIETNTLPGLTPESLLPKALDAVGVTFSDFLDHLIGLALQGKRR